VKSTGSVHTKQMLHVFIKTVLQCEAREQTGLLISYLHCSWRLDFVYQQNEGQYHN